MPKLNVLVSGSTGYIGIQLVKSLVKHKYVKIKYLCGNSSVGKKISYFDKTLSSKKLPTIVKFNKKYLEDFLPASDVELEKFPIQVHYLGYYLNWVPQETYYYSVDNCGFRPRPFRTTGTYSKYNSIDDKIDDLHYYTTFIKFGIGRATYDVSQEIRNDHLNLLEGKKLIKKYDGEFPNVYIDEILKYLGISRGKFMRLQDSFKSPHLWKKKSNKWYLRYTVNKDGYND